MAWYNFWKKEEEKPLEEVSLPTPEPFVFTQPARVFKSTWRNGMWVMTSKGIGIVFDLKNNLVHLVNENGETVNALVATPSQMRQARFEEIPKSRKVGLTADQAAELGYM